MSRQLSRTLLGQARFRIRFVPYFWRVEIAKSATHTFDALTVLTRKSN